MFTIDSERALMGSLRVSCKTSALRAAVSVLLWSVAAGRIAQGAVPPQAVEQFENVIGDRVETVTILGGDYGAAGGIYTFRGGDVANLSIGKIGGGGDIAEARPLGETSLKWAPMLIGNVGHVTTRNEFRTGYLRGNESEYDVLAAQLGGGARFYFTDQFSMAPAISGIYGHTENDFKAENTIGDLVKTNAKGTYVDWRVDTWSVAPSVDAQYDWLWGRVAFEFSSRYTFFHTEDFHSSSEVVGVNGDSHMWENKLDVDAPLGWKLFGRELRAGGFFARTELFGGAADGLNENHVYTVNGRFVMDLLGKAWKVRWLGFGASYLFGKNFDGWTAGVDLRFQF